MKKITALILALSLLFCLSGCAESHIESYTDEEIAEATEAALAAEAAADPRNAYPADTVVATVSLPAPETEVPEAAGDAGSEEPASAEPVRSEITWDEYFYWLDNYRMTVENSFGEITDWAAMNAYYSSNSNDEVVRVLAQGDAAYYHMILAEVEARGLTMDPAEVEAQVLADVDLAMGNGDGTLSAEEEELFEQQLVTANMSRDLYTRITQARLSEQLLFDDSTQAYTEADALAWGAEQGLMNAKHILLLTVDAETREPLDEEAVAAAKEKAEALYEELAAAYVPATGDNAAFLELFDELMMENSEDTGLAANPNGYVFQPGQMVAAFETAVKGLNENYAMSEVVESDYGFHIILRQPVAADCSLGQNVYGQSVTLLDAAKNDLFNQEMASLSETVELVWTEGFETLSMEELFGY